MAVFKLVTSDPKSRKSYQMEIDQTKAVGLIGKKIGEEFNCDPLGLNGYVVQIAGGTDKDGFPMHPGLKGSGRKKLLLTEPPGFHPTLKGQRRRKMVCGNTISDSIVQVNVKVVKYGDKPLEEIVPKKEKKLEEKKEKPKEEAKKPETKPEEKKTEAKPVAKPEAKSETKA